MVWVYSYVIYITYLPLSFPFYWQQTTAHCPLFTARCTLLIVYPISKRFFRHVATLPRPSAILKKSILPPKKIPRRRPPGISHLQYHMQNWGPAPGKVSPGEAWRDRPLLKRRVSPRSSSLKSYSSRRRAMTNTTTATTRITAAATATGTAGEMPPCAGAVTSGCSGAGSTASPPGAAGRASSTTR